MPRDNAPSIGAWTRAELAVTANTNTAAGADAGLALDLRFIRNVGNLVRTRSSAVEFATDRRAAAVFLLSKDSTGLTTVREPMLDNGQCRINGRLWFVSPAVVDGEFLELPELTDADLFKAIVETHGRGKIPAVVFKPALPGSAQEIRYYPAGLIRPESVRRFRIGNPGLRLSDVFAVVDKLHVESLITPVVQPRSSKLWKDAAKWHVVRDAEDRIQALVRAALSGAFLTCAIRFEAVSAAGRYDIAIEESDPRDRSVVTRHAILELKVLRSFGSGGASVSVNEVLQWIKDGVGQAAAYKKQNAARLGALCCFDMRKEDTGDACFGKIKLSAKKLRVELRRWYLYPSASAFRVATTTS